MTDAPPPPPPPKIAAVVLAAVASRRMGAANKLLADLNGAPLVRRTVESALSSRAGLVVAVVADAGVAAALDGLPVQLVFNPDAASGMASSLKAGLAALPPDVAGVAACLGDMPLAPAAIDRLIAAFDPAGGRDVVAPTRGGRRGHPVLWGRAYFGAIGELSGDVGARGLLSSCADRLVLVETDDEGVLFDVDTPEDLEKARLMIGKNA